MTEFLLERDIAESIVYNKLRNLTDKELLLMLYMLPESIDRTYKIVDRLPKEGNVIKKITDF